MASWQEIGVENFRAAVGLYERQEYRSAASRFYYAAFSVLTHELIRRGAQPDFRDNRATPSHAQLPGLVLAYFGHFSQDRLSNLLKNLTKVYADRLNADYNARQRIDKRSARDTYRAAEKILRYLGAN